MIAEASKPLPSGTLKKELREGRAIGKMSSGQIMSYLAYRHRVGLLASGYPLMFLILLAIAVHHYH